MTEHNPRQRTVTSTLEAADRDVRAALLRQNDWDSFLRQTFGPSTMNEVFADLREKGEIE